MSAHQGTFLGGLAAGALAAGLAAWLNWPSRAADPTPAPPPVQKVSVTSEVMISGTERLRVIEVPDRFSPLGSTCLLYDRPDTGNATMACRESISVPSPE